MRKLGHQKHYYLMLLPGMVWLVMFSIVPMFGILMAFQDFNPGAGLLKSEWVGLENFKYMFQLNDSKTVIVNTFIIAIGKIVLNLLIPLIFAILLNELRSMRYKKLVQTVVYLPHFLSWVIMSTIVIGIFGYYGVVNTVLECSALILNYLWRMRGYSGSSSSVLMCGRNLVLTQLYILRR